MLADVLLIYTIAQLSESFRHCVEKCFRVTYWKMGARVIISISQLEDRSTNAWERQRIGAVVFVRKAGVGRHCSSLRSGDSRGGDSLKSWVYEVRDYVDLIWYFLLSRKLCASMLLSRGIELSL